MLKIGLSSKVEEKPGSAQDLVREDFVVLSDTTWQQFVNQLRKQLMAVWGKLDWKLSFWVASSSRTIPMDHNRRRSGLQGSCSRMKVSLKNKFLTKTKQNNNNKKTSTKKLKILHHLQNKYNLVLPYIFVFSKLHEHGWHVFLLQEFSRLSTGVFCSEMEERSLWDKLVTNGLAIGAASPTSCTLVV